MAGIVVGVDDSKGSRAAWRWAMEEARVTGRSVVVIHAWRLELGWIDEYRDQMPRMLDAAQQGAQRVLDGVLTEVDVPPGVHVEAVIEEGHPVEVLLGAAKDADLLVLGSRGRGKLAGLLLGSVSRRCIERSLCPAVVVPAPS